MYRVGDQNIRYAELLIDIESIELCCAAYNQPSLNYYYIWEIRLSDMQGDYRYREYAIENKNLSRK